MTDLTDPDYDGPWTSDQTPRPARIAHRCAECGRSWTTDDDANEWAYGHDCEA